MLVISIIGLANEGISSYLHNKRQKALHKAFVAMGDSLVMYDIYNLDTLEKLINTVHKMHNTTTWNENLFARNFIIGFNGIYLRTELAILPLILFYI